MRVSVIEGDVGFVSPDDRGDIGDITINGDKVEYVITADDEEGVVVCSRRHPITGRWLTNERGDEFLEVTMRGNVEISVPEYLRLRYEYRKGKA